MKQKIVIKVQMKCNKCRSKAMQLAVEAGVEFVALEGEDKDHLVLIGDGIDTAGITRVIRKRVGRARIIKVEEVKKEPPVEPKPREVIVMGERPECRPPIYPSGPFRPTIILETYDPCYYQVSPCSIL